MLSKIFFIVGTKIIKTCSEKRRKFQIIDAKKDASIFQHLSNERCLFQREELNNLLNSKQFIKLKSFITYQQVQDNHQNLKW